MWYVTTCFGEVCTSGSPVSRLLGWYTQSPPLRTTSNARGIVWASRIHEPQIWLEHASIQSVHLGSCSAPTVSVPPFGTVVDGVDVPDDFDFEPPPEHADATNARTATVATAASHRRDEPRWEPRTTLDNLPTSCISGPGTPREPPGGRGATSAAGRAGSS